jgi:CheY-like chemotaxis protein/anti-sigma regulatory factor (Ser/Thr protein kinase)
MKNILVAEDDPTTRYLLRSVLKGAGFAVATAAEGNAALGKLRKKKFDLLLTDIWMPGLNGLELMARLRQEGIGPKIVVMTSDDTPQTVLRAVSEQAYHYLKKPVAPQAVVDLVRDALAARPASLPIEVLSARPDWVELLVPCDLGVADRISGFMNQIESDLPRDVRDQIAHAFRELLLNAIEWGGKLDPNQKVRISYLRGRRMLLYRIADPGTGFRFEGLSHAAVSNPASQPWQHMEERDRKGLRPGGFGLVMVKSLADELLYNEAQNEVVFVKYLDHGGQRAVGSRRSAVGSGRRNQFGPR